MSNLAAQDTKTNGSYTMSSVTRKLNSTQFKFIAEMIVGLINTWLIILQVTDLYSITRYGFCTYIVKMSLPITLIHAIKLRFKKMLIFIHIQKF